MLYTYSSMIVFKDNSVLPFDRIYVVLYLFKIFRVYFYLPYFVIISILPYVFTYNTAGLPLLNFYKYVNIFIIWRYCYSVDNIMS